MAVAFGYPLWAGLRRTLPPAKERSPLSATRPWHPPSSARAALGLLGGFYVGLGLVFLVFSLLFLLLFLLLTLKALPKAVTLA